VQLIDELDLYIDSLGPATQRLADRVETDSRWLLQAIHRAEEHADDDWLKAVAALGPAQTAFRTLQAAYKKAQIVWAFS